MKLLWAEFISNFSKVAFLGNDGEPSWLGWIVLWIVGIFAAMLVLAIVGYLLLVVLMTAARIVKAVANRRVNRVP